MSSVRRIEIDHASGIVRCSVNTTELLVCNKEQIGIDNSDDLELFVKTAGGIEQAVLKMRSLINGKI